MYVLGSQLFEVWQRGCAVMATICGKYVYSHFTDFTRHVTSHFPLLERLIFTEDLSIFNATQLTADLGEFHTKITVLSTKPELETCQNYQLTTNSDATHPQPSNYCKHVAFCNHLSA